MDWYILTFSALTVIATIFMGFWTAKRSRTASDFFVAGRSVSVGWNASAISGEYLSAASFMGIAGMVMSSGYDALWYPVCYACGYLFLLLFIAGPLRRFGAYTIPDFAEGRFDSPVFRKIAVVFVLFIGFFYTMPQMKGAGTTLAYIFPGLPYWAGVVLVGAVITLNVALGGMKGITLVQAFQYWAKMFAISVPIFVLMAVYGHYGKQVGVNHTPNSVSGQTVFHFHTLESEFSPTTRPPTPMTLARLIADIRAKAHALLPHQRRRPTGTVPAGMIRFTQIDANQFLEFYQELSGCTVLKLDSPPMGYPKLSYTNAAALSVTQAIAEVEAAFATIDWGFVPVDEYVTIVVPLLITNEVAQFAQAEGIGFRPDRVPLPAKAPADATWLNPFGPLTTKAAKNAAAAIGKNAQVQNVPAQRFLEETWKLASMNGVSNSLGIKIEELKTDFSRRTGNRSFPFGDLEPGFALRELAEHHGFHRMLVAQTAQPGITNSIYVTARFSADEWEQDVRASLRSNGVEIIAASEALVVVPASERANYEANYKSKGMDAFPIAPSVRGDLPAGTNTILLRAGLSPDQRMTVNLDSPTVAQALAVYAELTGRQLLPNTNSIAARVDDLLGGKLSQLKIISRAPAPDNGVREHGDGAFTAAEVKAAIEAHLRTNGLALLATGEKGFRAERAASVSLAAAPIRQQDAGGTLSAEKAWLAKHEKPLALLYTYSLIIAIVCGTAGLPHILVRFYTNPDGTAAKKTTMWVMILIGVFYVFPPVFGVLGRNLLPDLYAGVGAKGTDKIVLELPRILNAKYPPLGSVLSGITCAGAFAAFMSTFSGLLVSMTGALAHDVYGRILRPRATAEQRLRMFKIGAVIIGGVAILLGMQVEQLQINFMVGQAFAIAAASYFPLLFMAVWWRKLTMKGAAAGMLAGGLLALIGISLTSFSDLKWIDLADFWAWHPLLRILCEQPAIWTVPLAILLMVVVSKLTASEVPADSRMKMLVLHAPEELGLKQEYIQEHQHGH